MRIINKNSNNAFTFAKGKTKWNDKQKRLLESSNDFQVGAERIDTSGYLKLSINGEMYSAVSFEEECIDKLIQSLNDNENLICYVPKESVHDSKGLVVIDKNTIIVPNDYVECRLNEEILKEQ